MAQFVWKSPGKPGVSGKIGLTLFLLLWMAIPMVMLAFLAHQALRTARTYFWTPTDCVILESRVVEPEGDARAHYGFAVKYRYTWQGRDYVSERLKLGSATSLNYHDMHRWVERFPAEAHTVCYVNPALPSEAVLVRETPWFLLIGIVPVGFIGIGIVVLWGVWRGRRGAEQASSASGPLSGRPQATWARGAVALFCAVFLVMGLGLGYFVFLRPWFQAVSAQRWQEIPCVILSSRVAAHAGSKSTTYSVDIRYRYRVAGREFRANRYNFAPGTSSGRRAKEEIVRRYPPNAETVCYVNPANPTDVVLVREAGVEWWFGLIPLMFVVVGAGGLYAALRSQPVPGAGWRRRWAPALSVRPQSVAPGTSGPVELRSSQSRGGKLLGAVLLAAFWNGILAVFVWQLVQSFQRGRPEWFLVVFLLPFVAVGLVLLGCVGYTALQLFAPGVRLRLSAAAIPLGGSAELAWEITGRATVIRRLRLWLEGREEVVYRHGTKTGRDQATFATVDLASVTQWRDIRSGRVRFTVPADTMHSFAAPHNKIVWVLRVHGEIGMFPDVADEFPLTILPQAAGQGREERERAAL